MLILGTFLLYYTTQKPNCQAISFKFDKFSKFTLNVSTFVWTKSMIYFFCKIKKRFCVKFVSILQIAIDEEKPLMV